VQLRTRGRVRDGDTNLGTFELEIADDGQGFDPSAIPAGHFGLAMMRERAQAVGATLQVRSQLGRGTRIVVAWRSGRSAEAGGSQRQQAARPHHEEAPHE
jgi:nitrate/nitrite-specific signal transduction histidine kinase